MTDLTEETIRLGQFQERIRQERETFDRKKEKDKESFKLRMTMGWIACWMLPAIAVVCTLVLAFNRYFPDGAVTACAVGLLGEIVGCMVAVWRAFASNAPENLEPVTPTNPPTQLWS